jgi:VPDSG-CTERM motif
MKLTIKKHNIVPPRKLALLIAALCAVMPAFTQNADAHRIPMPPSVALSIGDSHELGQVLFGIPTGDADITQYVNFMIGLPLGGSGHVVINGHDNLITRSNNSFGPLGTATLALRGTGTSVDLGAQGTYSYLFAKYDGPNKGSEVWFVGDLSGVISIPATWGRYGLSGWALFTSPHAAPDGGATVMLLGTALGALGMARRFFIG